MSEQTDEVKRLSLRRVAMQYGLPPRVVARAVACGDLPAVETTTDTGRIRMYISQKDAMAWFSSLDQKSREKRKSAL